MKKVTIVFVLAILVLFIGSTAHAQNAYVKLGGGYGLSLASQIIANKTVTSPTSYDLTYGSFGEGINFGLGFGYNVNSNFAFELAGSYILGKKFETTYSTSTVKEYANTICIMPSAVVKAPMKDITPYTRFGMVIAIPSKFEETTTTGFTGTRKYKESGGVGLGIQGALGINFKAGKHLGIFAEVFGIGMNYGPSKKENTETYSELGLLDPEVTYNESGELSSTSQPKPRYSFSSFGMNVGLTYTFGK
jgi:opacity protein-like surface antigen